MDDSQKDLLESAKPKLADTLDFNSVAEELQNLNLVSRDKVQDIKSKSNSRFGRNLQLLDALKESQSPGALDEFIRLLEETNNTEALKILRSMKNSTGETYRNLVHRIANTFRSPLNYPLGVKSHLSTLSSSSPSSSYRSTGDQNEPIISPMKEKHQATLITSGSGSSSSSSGSDTNINFNSSNRTPILSPSQNNNSSSRFELERKNLNLPPTNTTQASTSSANQAAKGTKLTLLQGRTSAGNDPHRPTGSSTSSSTSTEHAQNVPDQSSGGGGVATDTGIDNSGEQRELALWHPYEQTSASSLHYCSPSVSLASSESGSDSGLPAFERNIILDSGATMAITRSMEHRQMKVKQATVCHNNLKKDYPMTARPRGPCLIVNNVDFDADIFPSRKGSDEDAKRFDDIFTQLGFTVIMRRNQTADEMRKLFKDVARECKPEHNALFVFILSHGSEHGIYGKDGLEVYLENEIISCFDNRNCEAMKGKPKVFVIQACRGGGKDYGGDDTTDSIAWPPSIMTPPIRSGSSTQCSNPSQSQSRSSESSSGEKYEYPIRTDMLLVFSCLAGYVSVRNETAGSWLGTSLAFYIMKYAHKEDFLRILNLVTEDVTGRKSSQGLVQSIEVRQLGWKKNLYFNPGIYH